MSKKLFALLLSASMVMTMLADPRGAPGGGIKF